MSDDLIRRLAALESTVERLASRESPGNFAPNTILVAGASGQIASADANTRIGTHPGYGSGYSGFWRNGADYALLSDGANTYLNAAPGSAILLRNGNTTKAAIDANTNVWQTPTLLNGWVNFGAPYATAAYVKDINGVVRLRGLVRAGGTTMGTPIFQLPAGYRLTQEYIFVVTSNSAFGECRVDTDGNVKFWIGSSVWFSLNGITFAAF